MTRINSSINPKNLTDQHLLAELRELPRIFTAVNKRIEKNQSFDDIPEKFTLGTGHVKFFYDKVQFLILRYYKLRFEYFNRFGRSYSNEFHNLHRTYEFNYKNHTPTDEEYELLVNRITTRIMESKQIPRYYGKPITKKQAVDILKSSNSIAICI